MAESIKYSITEDDRLKMLRMVAKLQEKEIDVHKRRELEDFSIKLIYLNPATCQCS